MVLRLTTFRLLSWNLFRSFLEYKYFTLPSKDNFKKMLKIMFIFSPETKFNEFELPESFLNL